MRKTRVVVIGCGFAGLAALELLSRFRAGFELTAIDKSARTHFLPLLPDVIGRGFNPDCLAYPIADLAAAGGFSFLNESVEAVDLNARRVRTLDREIEYDYLVIASGSETNFYGNEQIRAHAYKLDDAVDAAGLRRALDTRGYEAYLVGGAGYTGIETATNLRRYLCARSPDRRVLIVERSGSILGPLPEWMKEYVGRSLRRMNIGVVLNTVINSVSGDEVLLSNGETVRSAMLIWTAGVRTSGFLQALGAGKDPQGRAKVDRYLRLNDSCFVTGDAAEFIHQGRPLRMGVQFSIFEGLSAAANIIRGRAGERLRPFVPLDPGYVVPMADNTGCGAALGRKISGISAIALHYVMCLYRLRGWRNKAGIARKLFSSSVVSRI